MNYDTKRRTITELGIAAYLNTASDELFAKGKPNHSHKHLKQIHECMRMWQKLHNNYFYPEKKKQDNTMNYEQKYKEALETAKKVYHDHRKDRYWRDWLTELFPELKESEDERIRKQLCDFLRDNMLHQDAQYFISWLEKQGENKPTKNVKTLDADKVIEWLNDQACLGWIEDIEVEKFVEQFKKDFEL